jgi:hypothetical protein
VEIQENDDSVSLVSFCFRLRKVLVCRNGGGHSVLVLGSLETSSVVRVGTVDTCNTTCTG